MAFVPDSRTSMRAPGVGAQAGTVDLGLRAYMLRVYNWMASGLVLTGLVAFVVTHTSLVNLFQHTVMTASGFTTVRPTGLGMLALLSPIAFVMVLSFGVNRLSRQAAQALFWVYCASVGLSLNLLFTAYTDQSIVRVFFITAGTFAAMSGWGYTTQRDLTRMGSFLMMGLFGILIAFVVNIFMHSAMLQLVASIIGVVVFTGLTAFDTQRIKFTYNQVAHYEGADGAAKRSVYDALSLYLNFVNLFTLLLQLTGTRSSNN